MVLFKSSWSELLISRRLFYSQVVEQQSFCWDRGHLVPKNYDILQDGHPSTRLSLLGSVERRAADSKKKKKEKVKTILDPSVEAKLLILIQPEI